MEGTTENGAGAGTNNSNQNNVQDNPNLAGQPDGSGAAPNSEKGTEKPNQPEKPTTADAIEKYAQSQVDKAIAQYKKDNAALQATIDKLNKDKMTDDEVKQLELDKKEKELREREKTIKDGENRNYALEAIKKAGLDKGGLNALKLVDFVVADEQKDIDERVKAFDELLKAFVKEEVDGVFKKNGRNPNAGAGSGANNENSIAQKLGERAAARNKQTNDVLSHYLGRKN